MGEPLKVTFMGRAGVNVDKDPLELGDNELIKAQNAVSEVEDGASVLRKREGLLAFNTNVITAGAVLGGFDLPLPGTTGAGIRNLLIGRGSTT